MKTGLLSILSAGLLLLAITACTPSGGGGSSPDTVRPLYLGDLDKKMSDIYSKNNEDRMNVCDFQWRDRILEISRALEEKRSQIEELATQNPTSATDRLVDFGSFKFYDDSAHLAGENKWTQAIYSWSRIAKIYMQVKDNPKDRRWVTVNRMARGMVMDDDKRITNAQFMGLTREAGPMILAIDAELQKCLLDQRCSNPGLSSEEENFLSSNLIYNFYIYALVKGPKSFEEKRAYLAKFAKRVNQDTERYGFHFNKMARVEGNTLIVPMDLSNLGEGAALFADSVEKAWNKNGEYSLKVESVKGPAPGYMVKVEESLGGRAYVNHGKFLMQLYNWGRIKTFTHEFGHIIGFKDTYFTTWNTDSCAYTQESNSGDLMSDSSSGVVLPEHWSALKKAYWNQ